MKELNIIKAIDFLIQCFPDQEEEICDASDQLILKNIERLYSGGVSQFIEDSRGE